MNVSLSINGRTLDLELDPEVPLLWVLRDVLGLTGTKFGCGIAACGACTVHIDGRAVRTCLLPAATLAGKTITTIEGSGSQALEVLQRAWIDFQVPQCGYCQSGMLMTAAALLAENPRPSDAEIDRVMTNICRCGTYQRVRRAIHAAAAQLAP